MTKYEYMKAEKQRIDINTETEPHVMVNIFKYFFGGIIGICGVLIVLLQIPFFNVSWFSGISALWMTALGVLMFAIGFILINDIQRPILNFTWMFFGTLATTFFILVWISSAWYLIPFGISIVIGLTSLMEASHIEIT
ncbi:MAG: hypothetical protein MRY57_04060 [Candidatus Pacebacteria bacterium]|nr:hypothetical protein [Candidatus Paceibacterota bacterium]